MRRMPPSRAIGGAVDAAQDSPADGAHELPRGGRVKLMQCLCKERHCLLGMCYLGDEHTDRENMARCLKALEALGAERRCGICGSAEFTYEAGETFFDSLPEAEAWCRVSEADGLLTRAMLDAAGLTVTPQNLQGALDKIRTDASFFGRR